MQKLLIHHIENWDFDKTQQMQAAEKFCLI